MAKELTVSLVAADRPLWTGAASMIVVKTTEGEIGLLAGHEPMLAILVPGQIRITTTEGSVVRAETIEGGFLSIESDAVMVVVRNAILES